MSILVAFLGFLTILSTNATLNPDGTKCGQQRCSTTEYCSPFDTQCRPCSSICDPSSHNHQTDLCVKDCQEYLHDQRYVLRTDLGQSGDLRAEVHKLTTLLKITLSLTCLSIIAVAFLLGRIFLRCDKLRNVIRAGWFRKKWIKKATNNNKIQDDAELGTATKQNGLKLSMPTMPTISGTVSVSPSTAENTTPNTTSTPLSRRHPSEDTTLDYAYDNPAMTPSPEASQPRTKRESSF